MRLLLVEDDELFRLGLKVRLQQEDHLEIVAETDDGETALDLMDQYHPDLVLLDIGLPGIGGVETCVRMKERHPKIPILVLSSHSQPSLISRLIALKVQGYCLKGVAPEVLLLAIASLGAGATWWDPVATAVLHHTFQMRDETQAQTLPPPVLTQREREILQLIATGKSNPEIAQILYISPGTVRVHVHAILKKLGVRDRTQAAVLALQTGLVTSLNDL
jgi:two-component system NarL family response regulator